MEAQAPRSISPIRQARGRQERARDGAGRNSVGRGHCLRALRWGTVTQLQTSGPRSLSPDPLNEQPPHNDTSGLTETSPSPALNHVAPLGLDNASIPSSDVGQVIKSETDQTQSKFAVPQDQPILTMNGKLCDLLRASRLTLQGYAAASAAGVCMRCCLRFADVQEMDAYGSVFCA